MIVVISPAKKLNFDDAICEKKHTVPDYLNDSKQLITKLRALSKSEISKLMGISDKLAELNFSRYKSWKTPFTLNNSKQAILVFQGDVYVGLNVTDFKSKDFAYAQKHLRILSGLYGLLRPLDLIQPYRLEMSTKISVCKSNNLYQFWGKKITESINKELKKHKNKLLINLASQEYFKSIADDYLAADIITPVFKERKGNTYKVIGLYAKKARGMMGRYIIKNQISDIEKIKAFNIDNYTFNTKMSNDREWVFTR
jgi:hypothetical protein